MATVQTFYGDISVKGNILGMFPVGAVYMSTSSTSPAALFGGTWTQIKDVFLLAAGSTYTAGSTGGSADAVVVAHNHTLYLQSQYYSSGNLGINFSTSESNFNPLTSRATDTTGVDGTGKNMPPYLTVYMWKRVS